MTNEPISESRQESVASKAVGTGFHTFILDDDKVLNWSQKIQNFNNWKVTKNLVEHEKYLILS